MTGLEKGKSAIENEKIAMKDELLISGINTGDGKAFEILFHRYYASLCFFANKFLQDTEAAKDVVQEVFIRFYETEPHFVNLIALKSFLYECVQHKALNALEKRNTHMAIRQKLVREEAVPDEYFRRQVEAEVFEAIFTAIEELPQECGRIFKLSYIENKDIHEIAEMLHISETTVKTQRQRAKNYLRKRLKNLYFLVVVLFF